MLSYPTLAEMLEREVLSEDPENSARMLIEAMEKSSPGFKGLILFQNRIPDSPDFGAWIVIPWGGANCVFAHCSEAETSIVAQKHRSPIAYWEKSEG